MSFFPSALFFSSLLIFEILVHVSLQLSSVQFLQHSVFLQQPSPPPALALKTKANNATNSIEI
jgi:hypothetical protein